MSGMQTRARGKPPAIVWTSSTFAPGGTSASSPAAKRAALASNRRAPASFERATSSRSSRSDSHASGFTPSSCSTGDGPSPPGSRSNPASSGTFTMRPPRLASAWASSASRERPQRTAGVAPPDGRADDRHPRPAGLVDDPVRVAAAEELAEDDEDVAAAPARRRRQIAEGLQRLVGHVSLLVSGVARAPMLPGPRAGSARPPPERPAAPAAYPRRARPRAGSLARPVRNFRGVKHPLATGIAVGSALGVLARRWWDHRTRSGARGSLRMGLSAGCPRSASP